MAASLPSQHWDPDDDLEVMDEDEERDTFPDEALPVGPGRAMDGPATWEEVDTEELSRIALHICTSSVPSTDHAEAASRLAMQAANLDTDTLDPLNLGRLDTRQLQLVRFDKLQGRGGLNRHGSLMPAKLTRMSSRRVTEDMRRISQDFMDPKRGAPDHSALAALRSKVLPASETFDALIYLSTIHADTALEELEAGMQALQAAGSERTGQTKVLVKQNFDRFISCKTTIDDVQTRLTTAEQGSAMGSAGFSTGDVEIALKQARDQAARVFAGVLERAAKGERIRSSLALLKQYESLFRLPPRIRDATKRRDHEQVISDYRTAKALLRNMGAASEGGVWHNLIQEIEKGVGEMAAVLTQRLQAAGTGLSAATEAISALLQLQADGATSCQGLDPVNLYIATLSMAAQGAVAGALAQHRQRLQEARGRVSQDETATRDRAWRRMHSSRMEGAAQHFDRMFRRLLGRGASDASARMKAADLESAAAAAEESAATVEADIADLEGQVTVVGNEQLWLDFVSGLTSALTRHLPALWQLPQAKLPALAFISQGAKQVVEAGGEAAGQVVIELLQLYSERVNAALLHLATPRADKGVFLGAVRRIISGFLNLRAASAPQLLDLALLKVLQEGTGRAVAQMTAERAQLMENLPGQEDWVTQAAGLRHALDNSAPAPVTSTPGRLRGALDAGMAQVLAVMNEASRADHEQTVFNPLGSSASHLRHAFYDTFIAFAVAADNMASVVPLPGSNRTSLDQPGGEGGPNAACMQAMDRGDAHRRILILLANCGRVRGIVMAELASKYADLLAADGNDQEGEALQVECSQNIKQVEAKLVQSYQDSKVAGLDAELQEYMYGDGESWATCPLPTSVRDAAIELVDALVEVEAEVYKGAPELRVEVMTNVLAHLLQTFTGILLEQLQGVGLGGCIQLLLELQFLEAALPAYASQPAVDELLGHATDMLIEVIQARTADPRSAEHQALEGWVEGAPGLQLVDRVFARAEPLVDAALASAATNLACFQAVAAA